MVDLVNRLRERDVGDMMYRKPDPLCDEAAARIEQLERELAQRVEQVGRISEGWAIADEQLDAAQKELAAEKALADDLEKVAHGVSWDHPARAAYRKARGV